MMPRTRRLSDADIDLWLEVTRTVVPRPDARLPHRPADHGPARIPRPKPAPDPQRRPTAPSYSPAVPTPRQAASHGLDQALRRRLSRGRATVDDSLDLHGMTQAEAHTALLAFLLRSQARNARLVLVVTGKGERPRGVGEGGILRRVVPFWLKDARVRGVVAGFDAAGRGHGGDGALYVQLRRRDR